MSDVLYISNTNVVEWQTLTNSITGEADEAAAVTVTILDSQGNEVSGQSWPAPMVHDSGGTYRASLSHALPLRAEDTYTARIRAVGSDGGVGQRDIPVKAKIRSA